MNSNVRAFPGVTDAARPQDAQPDPEIIAFCEDLVERAKRGDIRAIAVAMVKPGRLTADGWRRTYQGADCCHELMAAITYLQHRFANGVNTNWEREDVPSGG